MENLNNKSSFVGGLLVSLCLLILTSTPWAYAQDTNLVPDKVESANKDKKEGWIPKLSLGLNYSLTATNKVIGQKDGDTTTIGLNLDAGYNYFSKWNEWRNSLKIKQSSTKTPTIPVYVKSADEMILESIYLYNLQDPKWLSVFASVKLNTPIFAGRDAQADPSTYVDTDGNNLATNSTEFKLTDGFKPMTLKEAVGGLAKIIDKKTHKMEARLGYGAQQIFADGQFSIDKSEGGVITLKALNDVRQSGLELGFDYFIQLDKKTNFVFKTEALVPFENQDSQNRDALELTNIDLTAKITTKLYELLSLSYEHRLVRQPQLLDATQTTDLLLLNLSYDFFSGDEKKKAE